LIASAASPTTLRAWEAISPTARLACLAFFSAAVTPVAAATVALAMTSPPFFFTALMVFCPCSLSIACLPAMAS
tara:strand:- start:7299 stop:7520 length:222 start_codon:yes stop_codon:yes gene_type:complete